MEWNPEAQEEAPFWPGEAQRKRPRWLPLLVLLAVVAGVLSLLIWILGGGDDADQADDEATQTPQSTDDTDSQTGSGADGNDDGDDTSSDGSAPTVTSTTTTTTTSTTVPATTTTLTTLPPDNPDQFGPATLGTTSTVSTVGLDTVHFGMGLIAAQEAAGTVLVPAGSTGSCYHVVPHNAPEGIVFLVHNGTIERVDINSGPITTRSGIGVGSPETLVTDLFGDSIERQVRSDGTIDLVFVPSDPGDRNYRVVFNIVDSEVRAFKSGRLPQVMLDTGCENASAN